MVDSWSTSTIGELCDEGEALLQTGPFGSQLHAHDYEPVGVPVIPTEAIGRRRLRTEGLPKVSIATAERLSRHKLKEGDILFARRGVQATGLSAIVEKEHEGWLCGTGAILLRLNSPDVDAEFLSFALSSEVSTAWLKSHAVGAVMPNLNEGVIRRFPLLLPPITEQQAIAHILGTLDAKIELNRRMNETLEATARALFKSWFVDFDPVRAKTENRRPAGMDAETVALFPSSFGESPLGQIPEGWQVTTLDDITELALGGDWGKDASAEDASNTALCIRGADIPDLQKSGVGKMPIRFLKNSSLQKRSLRDGDLVIEISGGSPTQSTGRPVLITNELLEQLEYPLVCSNFCRMVRLRNNASSTFVYLWLRWLYTSDAFLQYENGTTGIKNFAFSIFSKQFYLALPPPELLKRFEGQVGLLFKKQAMNGAQSRTLAALRDALLPKLLSGEIRVREAEREVEQVA